jgi:hypothetical protein
MRPMIAYLTIAATATIAVAALGQTSDSTDAQRRTAALVLDHNFTGAVNEPIRVFLAKDMTYHAETTGNGIQLQLKPLLGSTQLPLLQRVTSGMSAAGGTIYEIKPRADAVYVFTTVGGDPQQPVNLRVYAIQKPAKNSTKPR